jgi:hypothetical protein
MDLSDNVGVNHTDATTPPATAAAEAFFQRDLPALIVRELARFRTLHGTLAFSCAGKKFTLCLGDLGSPVVPGFLRTADVKVWFFDDAFERFLAGEPLSRGRQLRVEGDPDVLERFGRFLMPAASSLSVRFAA